MSFSKSSFICLVSAVLVASQNYNKLISQSDIFFYAANTNGDVTGIKMSDVDQFVLKGDIKIAIHGFTGSKDHPSVTSIRNAFLTEGSNSVFVVNWSQASTISYFECRYFVRPLAINLSRILMKFLKKHNVTPEAVHIIGHSLGAHIAGNMGRYFNGTIGRITGLDPAKPLFNDESTDDLRPNDAKFVDVIHTGAGALGDNKPRGLIDFYPNNGFLPQPGCAFIDVFSLTACSHFRAPAFYAESIVLPNSFPAKPCPFKYIMQQNGSTCLKSMNRNTAVMGEFVSPDARGIYFLETNNVPPYGMGAFSNVFNWI